MPHLPAPDILTLTHAWRTIADGLMIQRYALHVSQIEQSVRTPQTDVSLFAEAAPSLLTAAALPVLTTEARTHIDRAGLGFWFDTAAAHATEGVNPLRRTADDTAALITDGASHPCLDAVAAVAAATAWWIGTFSTIRHRGVHNRSLTPVDTQISLSSLRTATDLVTVGTAGRVLASAVSISPDEEILRHAYCRAVTEGIIREPSVADLLDDLAELRLVDLVCLYTPWRGQFTKYASGTGAGQVE